MGAPPLLRGLLLGLCTVLLAFNFSSATLQTERIVAVVGNSECLDCSQKSINTEEAFKGLHVTIQCKTGDALYETKGEGLLDKSGSFDVQLPSTVLREDGELKDECFAQLRSALEAPCPDNDGVGQSKIALESKENGKHTFAVKAGKLSFSSACTSAFLFKHLPKGDPFHKDLPLHKLKPKFDFHDHLHHHFLPHKPLFPPKPYFPPKKPLPPPVPEYKPPPVPEYKPPPVPEYKPPPVPEYKPPIVKKPFPPVPIYKKPPVPEYKPPIVKKPFPPVPIYKKPHPPIPKLPPLYHLHPKFKLPFIHKKPLPPFYHPHHKFPLIKKKPLLPIHKLPPIPKKPLPPIPKFEFPPIPKKPLPPIPKFQFPPKPEFYKKKYPIFPPVKENPIP